MRYFLDAEFNGYDGALISIALVPEHDDAAPFYEATFCSAPLPWVKTNIIPALHTKPIAMDLLRRQFSDYLSDDPNVLLTADWPEDIMHAARLLTNGKGRRTVTSHIRFELIENSDFDASVSSTLPHNAYYDALALKSYVLG
jgi:hypothetical protein